MGPRLARNVLKWGHPMCDRFYPKRVILWHVRKSDFAHNKDISLIKRVLHDQNKAIYSHAGRVKLVINGVLIRDVTYSTF